MPADLKWIFFCGKKLALFSPKPLHLTLLAINAGTSHLTNGQSDLEVVWPQINWDKKKNYSSGQVPACVPQPATCTLSPPAHLADLHCHQHCPRPRRLVMSWPDLHLEIYQHEPAACPRKEQSNRFKNKKGTYRQTNRVWENRDALSYLLVLLEKIVEIVAPLIVEIKVLALSFTFSAHHFSNGCPVSTVLDQACGIETKVTFYNSRKRVQRLNSLLMNGVTGGRNRFFSQGTHSEETEAGSSQAKLASLDTDTQEFSAHISRKGICYIQFNTMILLNYLYHLLGKSR